MRGLITILIIILLLPVFATEIELVPEAQLINHSSEYYFGFPITMTILDNELYVMDQKSGKVHVFAEESLQYLRSFGELGSEPGQFDRPVSIASDIYGNIVISDYNNDRFQTLTPYGEFVEELYQYYPWRMNYFADELYVDLFPGVDEAGIYLLDSNEFYQQLDINRYFKKENFSSVLEKYYSWCVTDWGYVLSFSGRDKVVLFNRKGRKLKTEVEPLPFSLPNTLYGKPNPYNGGFLLLGSANDHVVADTTGAKVNNEGFLGYYGKDGKLINTYKLPDNVWLTDTWTINGDKIYLYDSGRLVINRFRID